jgi:hypothetical protein
MSCLASATADCKQSTEVTAVMALASGFRFMYNASAFPLRLRPFIFRFQRRNDAGRAGIELWHTEQGRPGVTSYSRFFLLLRFWVFDDAMNITNLHDWLRAGLW